MQERGSTTPICRFGSCKYPVSDVKLSPIDFLILELFTRSPLLRVQNFAGEEIYDGLDWVQTESLARARNIPWNYYVTRRLEVCEQAYMKYQNERLEMKSKSKK